MSTNITLSPAGLFTNFNELSQVSPGSLLQANNIVIDEKGVIKPRRGIKYYSSFFDDTTARARQLLEYKGRIIRHVKDKLAFDDGNGVFTNFTGSYNDAASNVRVKAVEYKGNFYITSDSGVKKISAKKASDMSASSITSAGANASSGLITQLVKTVGGILAANTHTAYKVTWGYKDANNLLLEGVPSYQVEAKNATSLGDFSVDCTIFIPNGTTTNHFFRLYRCETKSTSEDLSNEFQLVFQGSPSSSEISAGYLVYNDNLSEDFRLEGTPLYTNPYSGEGADASNFYPPFATDIALYQNHLFYANTRLKHTKVLTLQSISKFVSGTTNFIISNSNTSRTYTFRGQQEVSTITCQPYSYFQNGDYFLVNSARNYRRYFFYIRNTTSVTIPSNSETAGRIGIEINISDLNAVGNQNAIATRFASVINSLDDFAASAVNNIVTITNIENGESDAVADSSIAPTGLSFNTVTQGLGEDFVNRFALIQNTNLSTSLEALDITARSLVDTINNDPSKIVTALYLGSGQIGLTSTSFEDITFYTDSTHTAVKTSWFPNLSSTANGSDSQTAINGLYFSKQDQPESVPLTNFVLVGSSDEPILRIVPLRESIFIFKTDGLYRLSGYDKNSFSVNLFDSTAILKAPDSAAVLRNQIYFFGTQGVSRVSEGGSEKISNPIDDKLLPFITTCPNLDKLTFAVSYETDQSYLLWTAIKENDTVAQVGYRYNLYTDTWVEWKTAKSCAVLNSNENKLYFGSGTVSTLEVERKQFNRFDYCDREIDLSLATSSIFGNVIKPAGASNVDAGDVIVQTQGVTIFQFNQLLKMMSTDISVPGNDFLNYQIKNGDSLTTKISTLVNHLNTNYDTGFEDNHNNTSYVFSGSDDIYVIQDEWFKIVDRLNQSPTFFYSNYPKYDRLTLIEAPVVSRDISNNDIYLSQEYPFLEGDMLVYKSIPITVEFVPQTNSDPVSLKQFTSCQIIFQKRNITAAQVGFSSDLSAFYEYITFSADNAGTWGNFSFGDTATWGGDGDKAPLRTLVPAKKQRCRFINVIVKHQGALESFSLYGLSLSVNTTSDRAYR